MLHYRVPGYHIDTTTLDSDYNELFTNLNDGSNEGKSRPYFTAQFGVQLEDAVAIWYFAMPGDYIFATPKRVVEAI